MKIGKCIGVGYYYAVFDTGDGRVRKKVRHPFFRFFYILFSENFNIIKTVSRVISIHKELYTLPDVYRRLIEVSGGEYFGDIQDIDKDGYTQNVVERIHVEHVQGESWREFCELYRDTMLFLWKHGITERAYKFTLNGGIKNKKYVLFDCNECSFSYAHALSDVDKKVWKESVSYRKLSKKQKVIVDEVFAVFSPHMLREVWGTALKSA